VALCGSLAALLVAALNLLRTGRPADRALAWVSCVGSLAWMSAALAFGVVVGNILDPRAMIHAINAAVLALFSIRTALHKVNASQ
jgi:hypothetical protein